MFTFKEQLTFISQPLQSRGKTLLLLFSLLCLVYHLSVVVRSFLNRSYEEVAVSFVKPYNGLRLESSYVCLPRIENVKETKKSRKSW